MSDTYDAVETRHVFRLTLDIDPVISAQRLGMARLDEAELRVVVTQHVMAALRWLDEVQVDSVTITRLVEE